MQNNEGPPSVVSSSTASLHSARGNGQRVIPSVEVDTACSSPGRNQSLQSSACSSPAGVNHVVVHVGPTHNGGGGAVAESNASQNASTAIRPQSGDDNTRGSVGETERRAAGTDSRVVNGGAASRNGEGEARAAGAHGGVENGAAADKNGEGDVKQGLHGQAGSLKKGGSMESRVSPSQTGTDERPMSAGMTECRICLSTEDAEQMVSACSCSGTQKWAHMSCLSKWVVEKRNLTCELCNTPYSEPYATYLQQELNKRPPRHGDGFASVSIAGQAQLDGTAPNAAAVSNRGTFSTPLTNPWSRIDYWLTLITLLAALIIILYFASRNWQVIVWGVIVAFVPITAGLSLLYMLIGKAIESHRWREREAAEQTGRRRERRGVNITFSPFLGVGMHA